MKRFSRTTLIGFISGLSLVTSCAVGANQDPASSNPATQNSITQNPVAQSSASQNPAENGILQVKSAYSVTETGDRLEAILQERGLTQFARIDHAAGAQSVDLDLQPTELIIFGNPKVGTPLMQCNRQVAIDLPQKALIWQENGDVWIGYNNPRYLLDRHALTECEAVIERIEMVLDKLVNAAAQP